MERSAKVAAEISETIAGFLVLVAIAKIA